MHNNSNNKLRPNSKSWDEPWINFFLINLNCWFTQCCIHRVAAVDQEPGWSPVSQQMCKCTEVNETILTLEKFIAKYQSLKLFTAFCINFCSPLTVYSNCGFQIKTQWYFFEPCPFLLYWWVNIPILTKTRAMEITDHGTVKVGKTL